MTTIQVSSSERVLVTVVEKHEPSYEQAGAMSTFLADLLEAAASGKLESVDRNEFRSNLGLACSLPDPTITQLADVVLPAKSVSIQQRVQEGNYNWSNSDINGQRFSVTLDAGSADLWLAHFNADIQTEDVEAWAMAHGYEVALVEELLAVGAHPEHRKLQLDFPIIALGSSTVVFGDVRVPFLSRYGSERELSLSFRDFEWPVYCRFLLRKVQPLDT